MKRGISILARQMKGDNIVGRYGVLLFIALLMLFHRPTGFAQSGTTPKPVVSAALVAVVWPTGYSEVYSRELCAVSNIDFTVFRPIVTIETADAIYKFSIRWSQWSVEAIWQDQQSGTADARGYPTYWPQILPSLPGSASYVSILTQWASGNQVQNDRALLDLLHQYYQADRVQIDAQAALARIEAAQAVAAEAARAAAELLPPGPPVIFDRIESAAPTPTPAGP